MTNTAVPWCEGVRKRVLRDTTWDIPVCTIADETRCGRKKVRPATQLSPESFNVSMNMYHYEYKRFMEWFNTTLRRGAVSFMYPTIDDIDGHEEEYRFVPGSNISPDNPGGLIVHVPMQWEKV